MRYELINSNDDDGIYAISDSQMTHSNVDDLKANGGDIVCLRPGIDGHEMSEVHWPENARRIVALLNAFDGKSIEYIEDFARQCESVDKAFELPPEAHVEFSDDSPVKDYGEEVAHHLGLKFRGE